MIKVVGFTNEKQDSCWTWKDYQGYIDKGDL